FAGSDPAEAPSYQTSVNPVTGQTQVISTPGKPAQGTVNGGKLLGNDFFLSKGLSALAGQFAILSAPQLSVTLSALNEDTDTEFLANPRVVTADNMPAKIEIIRAQPVPELAFNSQTAQSVFNGFSDKTFGNTLLVKPSVNKENFITLAVKPIISNKVGDQPFTFQGATVVSPIIDTRSLESNVLIKSGDTLAIGGLMQDEVSKARTKVPVMGDIPVLGYLFQSRTNARVKRNLLVFVTPTIIDQKYGTGLEEQVSGLHHSGEEFADPNGWRNNAKGAVRLVPTSQRQIAADYPKPGMPPAPARTGGSSKVRFMADAKDRDQ
ncbi:MAG: type II and III secretion system protein, partial [Verrucomicrobiota bacterium]|nr:type II and III secretion system protein [Verrucomicrobiota bacterium]